jgi:hypothetical protein
VNWDDIKHNFPKNLKISPLAAVPRKSRVYQMILDLSFQLLVNGNKLDSVNASSDKSLTHQESTYELGNVIPRIIWTMALSKDKTSPFMFTKVDLNSFQAIRVFAVRVTPIFTNKKHALNTLKMAPLLRSDVMLS